MFGVKEYTFLSHNNAEELKDRLNNYLNKGYLASDTLHITGKFISENEFWAINGERMFGALTVIPNTPLEIFIIAKGKIMDTPTGSAMQLRIFYWGELVALIILLAIQVRVIAVSAHIVFAFIPLAVFCFMLFSRFIQRQILLASLETIALQK